MLITTSLDKGIENAVGKPVKTSDGVLVGTVVCYDKESGIAVLDVDSDYLISVITTKPDKENIIISKSQ